MVIPPWPGVKNCPDRGHHITCYRLSPESRQGDMTQVNTHTNHAVNFVCPQCLLTSHASQLPRLPPHQSHCHGYLETTEGAPSEVRATQ